MLSLQWELWSVLCGVLHYSDQSDFNTVLGLKISNLCSLLHCPMQWGASLGLSGICSLPQGVWGVSPGTELVLSTDSDLSGCCRCSAVLGTDPEFHPFSLEKEEICFVWITILNSECSFSNDYFFFFFATTVVFSVSNSLERKKYLFIYLFILIKGMLPGVLRQSQKRMHIFST